MAHRIVYDHMPVGDDPFHVFRVLLEPYTNRVSLRFRTKWEAANGLVGTPEETISYLDERAQAGAPWDSGAPREARKRLQGLAGAERQEVACTSAE
ncbi:MAG: hypothetical protein U9R79_06310 [Armatimonadota bacterium]|nr:hypothetical protein [Armatimonadota bacterium]